MRFYDKEKLFMLELYELYENKKYNALFYKLNREIRKGLNFHAFSDRLYSLEVIKNLVEFKKKILLQMLFDDLFE